MTLIDRRRSMGLDVLAALFDVDGVRFVSFQFGAAREQLAIVEWPVIDAMERGWISPTRRVGWAWSIC
jgi:hypothetical protein